MVPPEDEEAGEARRRRYEAAFRKACNLGVAHGFDVPSVPSTFSPAFGDVYGATALQVWNLVERLPDPRMLVGGCLHVSYFLRRHLEQLLGMPTLYTLGAVTFLKKEMFDFDERQLRRWLRDGVPQGVEGLHAWLTLPTMEVVDFTWAFTMAATVPHLIRDPFPIAASPRQLRGMSYRPILVGNDFVHRVGAIRFVIG